MKTYDPRSVRFTIDGVPVKFGEPIIGTRPTVPVLMEYAVAEGVTMRMGDGLTTDDQGRIVRATPSTDPRDIVGFLAADTRDGWVFVQPANRRARVTSDAASGAIRQYTNEEWASARIGRALVSWLIGRWRPALRIVEPRAAPEDAFGALIREAEREVARAILGPLADEYSQPRVK